jgi:ribosomal protein L6P/L9E
LNKTSLIVFGMNSENVYLVTQGIFSWRPLNIFTSRGVRFSKQVVYKKSGKVSSYR